jgi:hypothetical protein
MEALTPASAGDLPPLGERIVDDPSWRYPAGTPAREGVAHLRVWLTPGTPRGHLAVVTDTGITASVTDSIEHIWAMLAGLYGRSLVLLEHHPVAQDAGSEEHLDLVRAGPGGRPHWTRVWPTPEDHPRHDELDAWMAAFGHQIISGG